LYWWDVTLSNPSAFRTIIARGPLADLGLFVDASTDWGIGILLRKRWDAWQGIGAWKGGSRHIGWLETVALELIIYAIEEEGLHDAYLRVHSDNQGVIGAFDKGRSRNHEMNLRIRRSHYILAARNVTLDLTYIRSADNPADPISRGFLPPPSARLPTKFDLPNDIVPYFRRV
ncbi:reverse transcriptase ribonuclease h, partial [Favolaschia claudopus]